MVDFDLNAASSFNNDVTAAMARGAISYSPEDLLQSYEYFQSLLPKQGFPMDGALIRPQAAFQYSKDFLQNFAKERGLNLPVGLIDYVASAAYGKGADTSFPQVKMLTNILAQGCTTAITSQAKSFAASIPALRSIGGEALVEGVAGIGVTTAAALADGSISAQEGKAILQTAGSLAGSVMGTALSATAVGGPIGAAAGIVVGALLSALIPDPLPPPRVSVRDLQAQQGLQVREDVYQQLMSIRETIAKTCKTQEASYWESVDGFLVGFAERWAQAERMLGHRFELRWFEDAYGPAFWLQPSGKRLAGARWALDYVNANGATARTANYWTYVKGGEPVTRCMLPSLGCPYPDTMALGEIPVPSPSTYPGSKMFSSGAREVQAMAARGTVWVPQSQRLDCERFLPYPDFNFQSPDGARRYQDILAVKNDEMLSKVLQFNATKTLMEADLMRTQAVMNARMELLVNAQKMKTFGADLSETGDMIAEGILKKRRFNNIALAGGVGVLGLALWRTLR
jgi:hypothetical protein